MGPSAPCAGTRVPRDDRNGDFNYCWPASVARGSMGATGRDRVQSMGPMTGHVSGQSRSPGDVVGDIIYRAWAQMSARLLADLGRPGKHRGDRATVFTGHGANDRPGYWPTPSSRIRCRISPTGAHGVQIEPTGRQWYPFGANGKQTIVPKPTPMDTNHPHGPNESQGSHG